MVHSMQNVFLHLVVPLCVTTSANSLSLIPRRIQRSLTVTVIDTTRRAVLAISSSFLHFFVCYSHDLDIFGQCVIRLCQLC